MNKEDQKKLGRIQRLLDKGGSVSQAAKSVGWRRQRAHAHVARGNLTIGGSVTNTTHVDSPEIYRQFGKVISYMIKTGKYGHFLSGVTKDFEHLVADINDKKAYNIVITKFAGWMMENCKPSQKNAAFIRYCAQKDISLLRKVCVARYERGQF